MLIPNPDLEFWNFDPKIHFWANLGPKCKVLRFVWKLVHLVSQRCWFLFQHWFCEFQMLISFLGKFGPKNSKLSILTENLGSADSESGLRFLKLSFLFGLKIDTHGILMMLILIPALVLWISDPKSIFGKIWSKKVKAVQFGWKLAHRVSRLCWFLFRHYFSQFPVLNPFFGQIWIEKF